MSRPHTFCRAVAMGSYLRNSCSYLHEAKAVVEAFNRIVYKHTQSTSSIKLMKLVKRKVTPFQATKPTCASELENQTLKAKISPHKEDRNWELVRVPCWEVRFFSPTESWFAMLRCAYLEKLCYSGAHVLKDLYSKAGLLLKNRSSFTKLCSFTPRSDAS